MTHAANDNRQDTTVAGRPCPICGKPATPAARPFCSKRCADVDLHRWLGGAYRVPVTPAEDDEAERVGEEE